MPTQARPFLMFTGRAEEAMTRYVSLFADGRVLEVNRYGAEGPGPEGSVMVARFRIAGLEVMCSDSYVQHAFGFTPSMSLFVDCRSEEEVDALAARLSEGGSVLMPLDDYGFSRRFAWVADCFGVSWQLNLP
ncbi:VOC family protein [Lysobacter antibioticus]|uniref:VOC family protein n=1 Tax=Lysobacter antibioticus TaxID=84531 RepID=UPI00034D9E46|nr:VOC family protein [Lysobacter antibioticus]